MSKRILFMHWTFVAFISLSSSRSSEKKRNSHTRIMNIYSNEQSSLYGEEYTSICKISMSFYPHSISIFNFRSNASKSLILSLKIIKFCYTECRFFENAYILPGTILDSVSIFGAKSLQIHIIIWNCLDGNTLQLKLHTIVENTKLFVSILMQVSFSSIIVLRMYEAYFT